MSVQPPAAPRVLPRLARAERAPLVPAPHGRGVLVRAPAPRPPRDGAMGRWGAQRGLWPNSRAATTAGATVLLMVLTKFAAILLAKKRNSRGVGVDCDKLHADGTRGRALPSFFEISGK